MTSREYFLRLVSDGNLRAISKNQSSAYGRAQVWATEIERSKHKFLMDLHSTFVYVRGTMWNSRPIDMCACKQ